MPWEVVSCQGLTGVHGLSWPLWAPADTAGLRWFQSVVGLVQSSGRCVEVKSLTAWKLSSRARGPLPHAGPWAGSRLVDLLYRPGPPAAIERGSRSVLGLDANGLRVVSESRPRNAPPRPRGPLVSPAWPPLLKTDLATTFRSASGVVSVGHGCLGRVCPLTVCTHGGFSCCDVLESLGPRGEKAQCLRLPRRALPRSKALVSSKGTARKGGSRIRR